MTTTAAANAPLESAEASPSSRWSLGLALLLVALEFAFLLTRFETAGLEHSSAPLLRALQGLHVLPRIGLAAGAAALLFAGERLRSEAWRLLAISAEHKLHARTLISHLISFAVFSGFALLVFEKTPLAERAPVLATSALFASLSLWLLSAASLFAPLRTLRQLALAHRTPLLLAALLGVGAWFLGQYGSSELWNPLRRMTLALSRRMLALVTSSEVIVREEDFVFGFRHFLVQVSPACSGFEGIGSSFGFLGVWVYLFRERLRFPAAFALPLIGALVCWFANAFRIAALAWIGAEISPGLAVEGFHSIAGMLLFCGIALATAALAQRSRFFARDLREESHRHLRLDATTAYLSPLLLLVLCGIVLGAFTRGFDVLHPLRPALVLGLVFLIRHRLPRLLPSRFCSATGWGLVAAGLWLIVVRLESGPATEMIVQSEWAALPAGAAAFWFIARATSTIVVAPLAEELAFRGYLLRRLAGSKSFERVSFAALPLFAWIGSSLLFGLSHSHWIAGSLCGAVFALAQRRGQSVGDAVWAHATCNAVLVALALQTDRWSLWLS